jgi:hypothetical protein
LAGLEPVIPGPAESQPRGYGAWNIHTARERHHADRQGPDHQSFRERGDDAKADKAQQELPDQVDTEKHSGLLADLGIDPSDLLGGLGGGLGNKLGL